MNQTQGTRLFIVRHGETLWNRDGRQQGHLDSDLTERGIKQAQCIADAFKNSPLDALYTSDLGRAMHTAQIVAQGIGRQPLPEKRLRERHLGIMQGMTIADFKSQYPDLYAYFRSGDANYAIPGGESIRQKYDRSVACCLELAGNHIGRSILIVTHGGILDGLFRRALGLSLSQPRCFSLFNASINVFAIQDHIWRLDTWGETRHLGELKTMDDW